MLKFINWEDSQRLSDVQLIRIKYDVFRQLVNFLILACNDAVKDLNFLYFDITQDLIENLKQFVVSINALDIKLTYFNETKVEEEKDYSEDEILEEIH